MGKPKGSYSPKVPRKKSQGGYIAREERLARSGESVHANRMCRDKNQYTKSAARYKAARTAKLTGDTIEFYKCQYCRHWHIGHPKGWEQRG